MPEYVLYRLHVVRSDKTRSDDRPRLKKQTLIQRWRQTERDRERERVIAAILDNRACVMHQLLGERRTRTAPRVEVARARIHACVALRKFPDSAHRSCTVNYRMRCCLGWYNDCVVVQTYNYVKINHTPAVYVAWLCCVQNYTYQYQGLLAQAQVCSMQLWVVERNLQNNTCRDEHVSDLPERSARCLGLARRKACVAQTFCVPSAVVRARADSAALFMRHQISNVSCDIHTHTPAQKSYTNFILYPFVI